MFSVMLFRTSRRYLAHRDTDNGKIGGEQFSAFNCKELGGAFVGQVAGRTEDDDGARDHRDVRGRSRVVRTLQAH